MRERKLKNLDGVEVKTGRVDEACVRYNLGKGTMRKIAADAGAVIHVGKCVLINFEIMDAYMMRLSGLKPQKKHPRNNKINSYV